LLLAQGLARQIEARAASQPTLQGCVVNLLDQKLWNPNPDYFSYTLSKAALREATVLLAQALAPRVRVVGVAPGITLVSGPMTEAEYLKAHALTPLQRSSTPQDIARAVRFVLESPAITGSTLLVDGGQHLAAQPRDVLFLAQHPG
jgi:NAD(P)-dependent dehydrogenase (short-subunit alcohol dehydrogenase family)